MSLSSRDISVIEEARTELRETPLPPAMGQFGCLAVIVGVVVLSAWPPLLESAPAMSFFTPFAMLFAIVAILGGPIVLLTGGQSGRSAARAAIEASLRVLEGEDGDREELLRAAAVLLERAYISQGPSTDLMIDVDEARRRIGDRIDLVLEVDRHRVDQHGSWAVFDAPKPPGD